LAGEAPIQTAATRRTVFPGTGSAAKLPAPVRHLRARVAQGVMRRLFVFAAPRSRNLVLGPTTRWLAASCRTPRISGRCTNWRRTDDNHSKRLRPRAVRPLAAAPAFLLATSSGLPAAHGAGGMPSYRNAGKCHASGRNRSCVAEAFDDAGFIVRIGIPLIDRSSNWSRLSPHATMQRRCRMFSILERR
jgi:hypothetical protein